MLYLIGLGLSDETDITVKGLEIVKKCSRVYLEAYTSILLVDKEVLVSASSFLSAFHFYNRGARRNNNVDHTSAELTLIHSRRNTMVGK